MGKIMRIGGKQEKNSQNETNLQNISDNTINNKKTIVNNVIKNANSIEKIPHSLPNIPIQKKEKKTNVDFEFKEEDSNINNTETVNKNKNNSEVNELKQEVTLLKDDLKDLKVINIFFLNNIVNFFFFTLKAFIYIFFKIYNK